MGIKIRIMDNILWEILEGIIGKSERIIDSGLLCIANAIL